MWRRGSQRDQNPKTATGIQGVSETVTHKHQDHITGECNSPTGFCNDRV